MAKTPKKAGAEKAPAPPQSRAGSVEPAATGGPQPKPAAQSDPDKIDEAVLALLLLGLHDGDRVWKSFDWDALDRLHDKGFISKPAGIAKSVMLSAEGMRAAEKAFDKLFSRDAPARP